MTLTLELTPEQEQSLEAEAQQRGMDRASYAKTLTFSVIIRPQSPGSMH